MRKKLFTIEGCEVVLRDDGAIYWKAKAAVDADGSGQSHGDPYYQPDTTLHLDGKPLNADVDQYIVVPPQIRDAVAPVVMGCQAHVSNPKTGKMINAVVGDIGPRKKLGELSVACAHSLGINPSPVSGGEDEKVIEYTIWPGVAAVVACKQYKLQPK